MVVSVASSHHDVVVAAADLKKKVKVEYLDQTEIVGYY